MSADRVRRFPLRVRGTYLVLAEASETDLRAFWQVSGDDLVPAVAGFARGDIRPLPVLRLRRLDGGGAGLVCEIALRLTGPGGQGEHLFSVEALPARYDVELGLSDGAGGWMMLARSNALDHAARLDVRLGPIPRQSMERQSAPRDAVADGAEWHHAGGNDAVGLNAGLAQPTDHQSGVEHFVPQHSAAVRPTASPSAPLIYGQASARPGELIIEAELRVNGCAAPGSEIDLFGYPYRVGPGGRFQFIIRVDDPELIARAFARNQPVLPERSKDD